MTNIDYKQSLFFYCSQSVTNNDQFRVNTQDLWSCLIKHNGHKYYKNNERSIINNCQKTRQTVLPKLQLSLYKPFRSSFMTYNVFAEKVVFWTLALQMPGKNRNHSYCHLVFGQNRSTKPTEHLCLPNKQLKVVLVWVSTWSCNIIGVIWSSKAYAIRTHFFDACIMFVSQ